MAKNISDFYTGAYTHLLGSEEGIKSFNEMALANSRLGNGGSEDASGTADYVQQMLSKIRSRYGFSKTTDLITAKKTADQDTWEDAWGWDYADGKNVPGKLTTSELLRFQTFAEKQFPGLGVKATGYLDKPTAELLLQLSMQEDQYSANEYLAFLENKGISLQPTVKETQLAVNETQTTVSNPNNDTSGTAPSNNGLTQIGLDSVNFFPDNSYGYTLSRVDLRNAYYSVASNAAFIRGNVTKGEQPGINVVNGLLRKAMDYNGLEYNPGATTTTKELLRLYQEKKGLKVDGDAGGTTLSNLIADSMYWDNKNSWNVKDGDNRFSYNEANQILAPLNRTISETGIITNVNGTPNTLAKDKPTGTDTDSGSSDKSSPKTKPAVTDSINVSDNGKNVGKWAADLRAIQSRLYPNYYKGISGTGAAISARSPDFSPADNAAFKAFLADKLGKEMADKFGENNNGNGVSQFLLDNPNALAAVNALEGTAPAMSKNSKKKPSSNGANEPSVDEKSDSDDEVIDIKTKPKTSKGNSVDRDEKANFEAWRSGYESLSDYAAKNKLDENAAAARLLEQFEAARAENIRKLQQGNQTVPETQVSNTSYNGQVPAGLNPQAQQQMSQAFAGAFLQNGFAKTPEDAMRMANVMMPLMMAMMQQYGMGQQVANQQPSSPYAQPQQNANPAVQNSRIAQAATLEAFKRYDRAKGGISQVFNVVSAPQGENEPSLGKNELREFSAELVQGTGINPELIAEKIKLAYSKMDGKQGGFLGIGGSYKLDSSELTLLMNEALNGRSRVPELNDPAVLQNILYLAQSQDPTLTLPGNVATLPQQQVYQMPVQQVPYVPLPGMPPVQQQPVLQAPQQPLPTQQPVILQPQRPVNPSVMPPTQNSTAPAANQNNPIKETNKMPEENKFETKTAESDAKKTTSIWGANGLKKGDKSDEVKLLQQMLAVLMGDQAKPMVVESGKGVRIGFDGKFGEGTETVVEAATEKYLGKKLSALAREDLDKLSDIARSKEVNGRKLSKADLIENSVEYYRDAVRVRTSKPEERGQKLYDHVISKIGDANVAAVSQTVKPTVAEQSVKPGLTEAEIRADEQKKAQDKATKEAEARKNAYFDNLVKGKDTKQMEVVAADIVKSLDSRDGQKNKIDIAAWVAQNGGSEVKAAGLKKFFDKGDNLEDGDIKGLFKRFDKLPTEAQDEVRKLFMASSTAAAIGGGQTVDKPGAVVAPALPNGQQQAVVK